MGEIIFMKKLLTPHLIPLVRNNRFFNHKEDHPESIFLHTIPSFITSLKDRFNRRPSCPLDWVMKPSFVPEQKPTITWLGHATFLIQINGVTILTDPVFESPSFLFPRLIPSIVTAKQLPSVDLVLLSHNHPDHTDIKSLKQLSNNDDRLYAVAQGDKSWMMAQGFKRVEEFGWWEQMEVQAPVGSVTITFLPAHHWSARGLFDRNKSLWGSWMIQAGDHVIYFGGDTAHWKHFSAIAQEFPSISAALLPISPCEPAEWMQRTHMNPEQAVMAYKELKAAKCIPMHWGTFPFGSDYFEAPIKRLLSAWEQATLPAETLALLKNGQSIVL